MHLRSHPRRLATTLIATVLLGFTTAGVNAQLGLLGASRTKGLSPGDHWDTFTTEVSIRTDRVSRLGKSLRGTTLPPLRYRMVRSRGSSGWRTTLTVLRDRPPRLLTPDGGSVAPNDSHELARVEENEDGSGPSFFDRAGRRMEVPSAQDLSWLPQDPRVEPALPAVPEGTPPARQIAPSDTRWLEAFMPQRSLAAVRRAALVRAHGRPRGRLRGLDRFLSAVGTRSREVLADPIWSLPREINAADRSRLVGQRLVLYANGPTGALIRRLVHSARPAPGEPGARYVTEMEFTNTRLELTGGAK